MKKIHIAALSALALTFFASAGADEALTAKLSSPLAKPIEHVSDDAVFSCTGDTCTATVAQGAAWSLAGCRDLVREVGAVAAYGNSTKKLSDAELATCNKSAHKKSA